MRDDIGSNFENSTMKKVKYYQTLWCAEEKSFMEKGISLLSNIHCSFILNCCHRHPNLQQAPLISSH